MKKVFRVTDLALVVYRGEQIVGVKHSEVSPWLVWDPELLRWGKAPSEEGRGFDLLPLSGHVES